MAVLRWDPWAELAALQSDVDRLLGRGAAPGNRAGGLVPLMDAFRTADGLHVRLELPGMRPDDVDVAVNDGVLTVAGERKLDADIADDAWVRRERPVGRFERSFTLPEGTDPAGIRASFDFGVLELHIPHPPQRRPHRVQVMSSADSDSTVEVEETSSAS
jgi:HSP20 family protein